MLTGGNFPAGRMMSGGFFSALLLGLSGCAGITEFANERLTRDSGQLQAGMAGLMDRQGVHPGGTQVSDGIFMAPTPERSQSAALLPQHLRRPDAVFLQSATALTLPEIAARLGELTGVPHLVALGPTGMAVSGVTEAVRSGADLNDIGGNERIPVQPDRHVMGASSRTSNDQTTMRPVLRGPLPDVLDQVANVFSVEWVFADGRILFRDYVTRQYQVSALPGAVRASSSIGAGEMSASSNLDTDFWSEISEAISGIVGDRSTVSLGRGSGVITVTARIADHDRVAEYINQLNEIAGQQIAFDVNVLTISRDDSEAFGVNLSGILNAGGVPISFGAAQSISGPVGSVNVGISRGRLDLDGFIQALSRQGRVSVDTRAGATTSNNRVVPIAITDRLSYIRSQTLERDSTAGRDRLIPETAEVETGFQLQIFPRVLNNREILIQYTVSLSELRGLQQFGDGSEVVQLPQVSETSFEQQAVVGNGETLVLAGFERQRTQMERSAPGNARLPFFGGRQSASRESVSTILLITPRLISRRADLVAR